MEAPGEIASAIYYANHYKLADVLIVGRGGGSIEDLWAFNEEVVAKAIYDSQIPVISAVVHEPDVTISDYVADLRAATPSNAAELAVPDQDVLRQTLDSMSDTMASILRRQIQSGRMHLKALSAGSALRSPDAYIDSRRKALELLKGKMLAGYSITINKCKQRYLMNTAKLDALSPLKVLTRGYSVTKLADGTVVSSAKQVKKNDQISVTVSDGEFYAIIKEQSNE